jgi:hypothetical protein
MKLIEKLEIIEKLKEMRSAYLRYMGILITIEFLFWLGKLHLMMLLAVFLGFIFAGVVWGVSICQSIISKPDPQPPPIEQGSKDL